jgi:hypothetical protein
VRFSIRRLAAALTLSPLLCAPAAALAGPEDAGFDRTFPAAFALCARAAEWRAPRRLAPYVPGIQAACGDLHAGYDGTQSELDAALEAARALPRPARRRAESAALDRARDEIDAEREAFWQAIAGLPNSQVPPNIPV